MLYTDNCHRYEKLEYSAVDLLTWQKLWTKPVWDLTKKHSMGLLFSITSRTSDYLTYQTAAWSNLIGSLQKNFLQYTFIRIDFCFHSVNTMKWYYINHYMASPATQVHMPISFYYYYKGLITHKNMFSGSYIKRARASKLLLSTEWSTRYQWHLCLELDTIQGLQ
jgi:hypothetical protein